ncbi:1266_t:CDS:10, partial [Dentiscutata erythropus]
VAVSRVEKFLSEPELKKDNIVFSLDSTIGLTGVDASWNHNTNFRELNNDFCLKNITLKFPIGKISLICGHKFSGKTMFFLTLLRETTVTNGTIHFPTSSVAYVPRQGWLESTNIRENILFGTNFEHERYWNIVDSCGLTIDFENMDEADFTECEDKDVVLTDGQKARISLARALYSSAQILLLDDCLADLEPEMARQIINNCLKSPLVSGRTVIMSTKYARYLLDVAEYIVVLGDGTVRSKGHPEEVHESGFLTEDMLGKDDEPVLDQVDKNDQLMIEKSDKRNWAAEEARSQGKVPFRVYLFYLKSSGGLSLWFILVLLFIIIRVLTVGETYWLKIWSENGDPPSDHSNLENLIFYIGIYASIAFTSAIFTIIRMAWQFFVSLKGSRTLFSKLLNSILRAPLSFFDTAPLGKVMNRFSKDLGMIDQGVVTVISSFLGNAVGAMSILVVVTAVTYEFGIVSILVELKRLQSMTRAPVVSWFGDSVIGIAIIRAFNIERYLILKNHDRINAGLAGFSLSYALGFVQIVFMLVKDYTTMETSLSSVEKIQEYIEMPQEHPAVITNAHPPAAWPTNGNIEVSNLTVQYGENEEPVLQNVSFIVQAEEKIGIVGRTGSGKTTLANSFLRLTEATDGKIVIDGIDIANIGLEDLRSRLTIISQDPILFEGTVRSNLDIRGEYNDHELWEALRRVHLIHIESPPNGQLLIIGPITSLDDPVNEGGSNFSRGQRQLLCLARSLLRQSRIIIMDEATASIDIETQNKIQEIITEEFRHATVLSISHRFQNIIDSDRILVLNEGSIVEFDTPYNLINDPDSLFRHLCEQTGELDSLTEMIRLNNLEEYEINEEENYVEDEENYVEDEENEVLQDMEIGDETDEQEDNRTERESDQTETENEIEREANEYDQEAIEYDQEANEYDHEIVEQDDDQDISEDY